MRYAVYRAHHRTATEWLGLIRSVMEALYGSAFVLEEDGTARPWEREKDEGKTCFVTSRNLGRNPFVKQLLIGSGVLTLVRLAEYKGKDGEYDPTRGMDREAIYRAAIEVNELRKWPDSKIRARTVYLVQPDEFDKLCHWNLWSLNDGANYVSRLTIRATLKAERELQLGNPSGQQADHPWDRPHMDSLDD